MGVGEKWSLRYVVGARGIKIQMNNWCKFSVPRRGVEKTENEKQKNRNHNISVKFGVKYRIRSEDSIVLLNSKTRLIMG